MFIFDSTIKENIMKRRLFYLAHSVKHSFNTFSEALVYAWKLIKFQFQLCMGIVKFKYLKKDGSTREAIGTLDNVPVTKGKKPTNYGVINYFDLEANDWRCFVSCNFLGAI